MTQTTEQLKQQFADMEKLEIPKFHVVDIGLGLAVICIGLIVRVSWS